MEISFSDLRLKEVINTQDGRRLGRVCDVILCYPENRWIGLVVPSGRGFGKKQELFLELRNIVNIGEDVILVNVGFPCKANNPQQRHGAPVCPPPHPPHPPMGGGPRGNFEEFE